MEMRDVTFTVPVDVAARFFDRVPTDQRESWFTDAVNRRMPLEVSEEDLIAACEAVNADLAIQELERDWEACAMDGLDEYPWEEPAAR